jgi:DNA polymerase III epsilon subunit-like protein
METTGLNKDKHEIIQFAGLVTVNGEVKKEFVFYFKPKYPEYIEESALKATGLTIEEMMNYSDDPKESMNIIDGYLKEFNTTNRQHWFIGGQNVRFDYDFLKKWWKENQTTRSRQFSDIFRFHYADLMALAFAFQIKGKYDFKDLKLPTIVTALGYQFEGKAHNALCDVKMTYKCYSRLLNEIP